MNIQFTEEEYAAISQSLNLARKMFQGAILDKKVDEAEATDLLKFLTSANTARAKIRNAYVELQNVNQ